MGRNKRKMIVKGHSRFDICIAGDSLRLTKQMWRCRGMEDYSCSPLTDGGRIDESAHAKMNTWSRKDMVVKNIKQTDRLMNPGTIQLHRPSMLTLFAAANVQVSILEVLEEHREEHPLQRVGR